MKICICSSMSFYEDYTTLGMQLKELGHEVIKPELTHIEVKNQDTANTDFFERNGGIDAFPVGHEIWRDKSNAIKNYFRKIDSCDCILVTNFEKKGIKDYIGPNSFLEMGHAFGLNKPIYILYSIPKDSVFREEISAMNPIELKGNIKKI